MEEKSVSRIKPKKTPDEIIVIVSLVAFLFATIYMFTIPMPTGFDITSFFG